jgi:hypothetical protein
MLDDNVIALSTPAEIVLVKALADERGTCVANVLRDLKQRRYKHHHDPHRVRPAGERLS